MNDVTTLLGSIDWRQPGWLLLVFTPLLLQWLHVTFQPKHARYAEPPLMPWATSHQRMGWRRRVLSKNSAFLLGWLLLGIAASGPRLPLEPAAVEQDTDMDILLLVDVSASMQATDTNPSRIRRAQIEIAELLERAASKRIGIIVFAARPHVLAPLTSDHDALRFYLHSLDSLTLPTHGSDVGAALHMAREELRDSDKPTAMVLLSDGDFEAIPETAIATQLGSQQQAGIPLFILGLGSPEGAAIRQANGEWLHHEGSPVISRRNDQGLRELAMRSTETASDERYSPVADDDSDWQQLYDRGIARLATAAAETDNEHGIRWQQLYHWPLFIAVLLLWIAVMPYALPSSRLPKISEASAKALGLLFAVTLLSLAPQPKAMAADTESQAYRHYAKQEWQAAAAGYKQLSGYDARFGEAASHYRMADFTSAIQQFIQATLEASNDSERASALLNLGNSYFQLGDYLHAESAYRDALLYRPADPRAQHNLAFTSGLKQTVEARRRQAARARAARMGRGPQRALAEGSVETRENSALAVDEGETTEPAQLALPELADVSDETLERLIQKGLQQIQLAAQQSPAEKHARYQRDQRAYVDARLRMAELKDRQTLLWKRLFEIEEGFTAPQSEPHTVPGVKPW